MITGFNTDIEHDGVVYHVQTEDKGLDSPLILSLVYVGGEILASKRSRYEDLIAQGFSEEVLAQRLKRQHRLICAAINAGRLEELKRMGTKAHEEVHKHPAPPSDFVRIGEEEITSVKTESPLKTADLSEPVGIATPLDEVPLTTEEAPRPKPRSRPRSKEESAYSLYDPRRQEPTSEIIPTSGGFALSIMDQEEFRAGESYAIRVLVEDRTGQKRKPLSGVGVSLKVLGTGFRPQIYSVKTERDGVATVEASMPSFTSGRAAVLVRVVVKGEPREVRRLIHPA